MSRRLFGTNGIRGVVGKDFTPEFIARIGQAVGTYFNGKCVLLARDSRTSSKFISDIIRSCLIACGCEVYDLGLAPTPTMQYLVKSEKFDGGVMITASHNPPEYNGIKVMSSNGVEIFRREEEKVENIFWEEKFNLSRYDNIGKYYNAHHLVKNYINDVLSIINLEKISKKNFRIVIDCANSVASIVVPEILKRLNVKIISLNSNLDGEFSGRLPEPTPETLQNTINMVKNVEVDFGVAYDGDADRAIFVDKLGRFIWGDRSGVIITNYLAEQEKVSNVVVTPVSSSILVEEVLSRRGLRVEWTSVGSIHVSYKVLELNALSGFEENGGFLYPKHHPVRDGIVTTVLMLELISEYGKDLVELINELPSYHPIKTKLKLRDRDRVLKIINYLSKEYESYRQIKIDGIKVVMSDCWFLVRPSGTEPVIRIFIEHKVNEKAEELKNKLVNTIKKLT